jgi:hypothetical protein
MSKARSDPITARYETFSVCAAARAPSRIDATPPGVDLPCGGKMGARVTLCRRYFISGVRECVEPGDEIIEVAGVQALGRALTEAVHQKFSRSDELAREGVTFPDLFLYSAL